MNKRGHVLNALLLSVGLGVVLEPGVDAATAEKIAQITVPIVLGALFPDVDTAFGQHRKTLHSLPVLAIIVAYPVLFDNLHFVWIGVVTHYLLDLVGSKRGLALFHPVSDREFALPIGVRADSAYADLVAAVVAGLTIALFWAVHTYVVDLDVEVGSVMQMVGV